MTQCQFLLSTIDNAQQAEAIAEALVTERLAACVNLVSNVFSIYKWRGAIEKTAEILLIIKTSEEKREKAMRRLVELHPYEVPEVIAFPIEAGHAPYLAWVLESVAEEPRQ
jgi:periplasmic divalent cation tolerance protein